MTATEIKPSPEGVPGAVLDPSRITGEELSFPGTGGDPVSAYLARPAAADDAPAQRPALIVIHEAYGLNEHIRDVVNRFANLGYVALGLELYSRQGGPPAMGDMPALMKRLFSMSDETVLGDLEAAAALLRSRDDVSGKLGCIGFCMGGRYTLLFAGSSDTLDAAVDCWGGFIHRATPDELSTPERPTPPLELAPKLSCPLLAAVGAEDQNPSPELAEQLRERALESGQQVKVDVYEGAGHAFFADYRPTYRPDAAARLWREIVPFLERSLRGELSMERKWWTLIAVSVAIFMLLLDITVVNVALPDIQRSLHSSFSDLQWVVNAYALTLAAFLLTSGAIADLIGRKRVFLAGLFVFTGASAVCGLSSSPLMLNLARAVQGTGGAMMFSTSLALLAQAFHGKERGTAFGVFGAVTGAAVAVGPVLGGVITSGIGWKWIFFVNIPIGAVAVFVTITQVADSRDPDATGVDWAGLVTFSGSLFLLVYALVQGNEKGWGSTEIVALLAVSVALLIAFLLVEHLQKRPMLDLALFRRPAFAGANIVAFALSGSFFAMFLYLTLYIQDVLGYSPIQAGLRFLPTTLLSFAVAPIAGKLSVRVPVRILLGSGLLLVGIGLLAMTTLDASSSWTVLIPAFVLAGAGVGLVNPPLASTAIGVVPHERSGMASGINSTFRQVGIATGIAGLGAVFQHSVTSGTSTVLRASGHLPEVLKAAHGQLGTLLESGEVTPIARSLSPTARTALIHSYRVGFTGAFTTIAIIAAVLALVGAVLAFVLVRSRDFVPSGGAPAAPRSEPVAAAAG